MAYESFKRPTCGDKLLELIYKLVYRPRPRSDAIASEEEFCRRRFAEDERLRQRLRRRWGKETFKDIQKLRRTGKINGKTETNTSG
jgi:hypothetical protein